MFLNVLVFLSLFTIFITPFTRAETLTSTTDAVEISSRATSGFDSNVTQNPEPDWRSNESIQQNRQPMQKVVNIDASSVHKYRRDGIENLPEHDYRRRYFLDFPEHYEYENELLHRGEKNRQQQYQQQRYQQQYQQHRNRGETYPVNVQGCPMRDSRPYAGNMPPQNQGIHQGWMTGSAWRGSHDDKRYESSYPLQVTTATPKVAPYRNRDYVSANREAGVSANRDYYDSPVRDIERNPPTWMQPYQQQQQSRNNRIVYYEYNLDDRRPGSGRCHPMDRNCGSSNQQYDTRWNANTGSSGRGSRFDGGHRFQTSDVYYFRNQQPYYSRPEGGRSEDSSQAQMDDYEDEDSYRYRNDGRGEGRQKAGIGYIYSIDLPMERAISPSTAYAYDMGFARKNQGYRHAPMPHLDT